VSVLFFIWLLAGLSALLVAGLVYEQLASAIWRRRSAPPGRLVDIGGRRPHLWSGGTAEGPTVVIEAGRFKTALMWSLVQAGISPFAHPAEVERQWGLMKRSQGALVALSSQVRLVEVPDCGHGVPLERPEAVVEAVRSLLGR
jgi:pimeloyl-ACP methyl ester carboxylesterase